MSNSEHEKEIPVADGVPVFKTADKSDPYIGCVLDGRYQIVELIDSGGYGNVYKGLHLSLGSDLAVKIIHKHLTQREDSLKRLQREAQLLSRLESPYIVRIMDYGLEPAPYIVMEYFDGMPLDKWLKANGSLKTNYAIDLFMQICQGLSNANELGLVHRDLKPSNIMLKIEDGRLRSKILDFGIAKLIDEEQRLTSTGEVLGSPPYMSPEQWKGQTDHRSDLYSLGCIMYEVLSSRPPFEAEYGFAYINQHLSVTPQRIRVVAPGADFPDALEELVGKCLAKSPDKRYQSADELLAELEKVKTGRKVELQISKERRQKKYRVIISSTIALASVAAVLCWQQESILGPLSSHLSRIADNQKERSKFAAAIGSYRMALFTAGLMPLQSRQRLHAMRMLSVCLRQEKQPKEAAELENQVKHAIGAITTSEFTNLLWRLRHRLFVEADNKQTVELAQSALKIAAQLDGKHSIAYSDALDALSSVMRRQGSYKQALEVEKESLAIAEDLLEENSIAIAARLNNEAEILRAAGDLEQAEKVYQRALKICAQFTAGNSTADQVASNVQPLIIADFDSGENINNLNGDLAVWNKEYADKTQGAKMAFAADDARGLLSGKCLQLDYDVDSPNQAYNGFCMKLSIADFTNFDTLNLYLKGAGATGYDKRQKIELKDSAGKASACLISGISDRWQKFSIPLDKFMMISDWSRMFEFVVVFEDVITSPKKGRIFLDHLFVSNENQREGNTGALTQMVAAYNGLARLKMQKQDTQGSLAYFEQAYQLCGKHGEIDSLPVLTSLNWLYREDKDRRKHLAYWRKALDSRLEENSSRCPGTEPIFTALADICFELKDYQQAEAFLEAGYLARVQAPNQDVPLIPVLEKWIAAAKSLGRADEISALERVLREKAGEKAKTETTNKKRRDRSK